MASIEQRLVKLEVAKTYPRPLTDTERAIRLHAILCDPQNRLHDDAQALIARVCPVGEDFDCK